MREPRPQSGFTLVELLVTMSLVTTVLLVLFSILSGGVRVWERIVCGSVSEQEFSVASVQLRSGIRGYHPFSPIPFKGSSDEFSFAALLLQPDEDALELLYEPGRRSFYFDRRQKQLCRAEQFYRGMRRADARGVCRPVLEQVESVRFRYYAYDSKNKSFAWNSQWKSEDPPLAVQAEVQYEDRCRLEKTKKTILVPIPLGPVG